MMMRVCYHIPYACIPHAPGFQIFLFVATACFERDTETSASLQLPLLFLAFASLLEIACDRLRPLAFACCCCSSRRSQATIAPLINSYQKTRVESNNSVFSSDQIPPPPLFLKNHLIFCSERIDSSCWAGGGD